MTKVAWFSTDWVTERAPDGALHSAFGGTFHYRINLPARALQRHGGYRRVFARQCATAPDGHLRVRDMVGRWHDDCDVIVFQRWMAADGADMASRAVAAGQVVVQDIDDDFWSLPTTNVARQVTDPRYSPHNRNYYRQMIEASSMTVCSTDAIAERVRSFGAEAVVCRNAIDIDRWHPHDPASGGMIGWVGGIAWRARDLSQLRGVLGPFLTKHRLPFYHGGHDETRRPWAWEQLSLDPATPLAVNPLIPVAEYPRLWDPVDLAVIPLEDCAFNRAKSWLKGLEASACGVPFVATRMPEYEMLGVGRLASSRREWRQHLEELLDPEVRRAEGAANRARAEELSIDRQWHHWDRVLRDLGARPDPVQTPIAA